MSKVIRIDDEVFAELGKRAVGFDATPNSVIRELLTLELNKSREDESEPTNMDDRISELTSLVGSQISSPPVLSLTNSGSYKFHSRSGKVEVFIYPQSRRLKVECSEKSARQIGVVEWEHWLKRGWFNVDNSVYWFVPNGDAGAYKSVAATLANLWRL